LLRDREAIMGRELERIDTNQKTVIKHSDQQDIWIDQLTK
jgi:hypothetical protein